MIACSDRMSSPARRAAPYACRPRASDAARSRVRRSAWDAAPAASKKAGVLPNGSNASICSPTQSDPHHSADALPRGASRRSGKPQRMMERGHPGSRTSGPVEHQGPSRGAVSSDVDADACRFNAPQAIELRSRSGGLA